MARTPNGRAIGYVRVSTDQQRESGLGLEAQRASIEQAAARLSLPLVQTYTDAGFSGSLGSEHRPGLADALHDLRRGDVLIVAKRDRIARDVMLSILIERDVQKKGAQIISAAGEGTGADADDIGAAMLRRIHDVFSEYERLKIGERTRAALRAKRARGERAGTEPFGYRVAADGCTLVEHEQEQRILSAIFAARAESTPLRAIARLLNDSGFTTRTGRPFRHENIVGILRTIARNAPSESAVQ